MACSDHVDLLCIVWPSDIRAYKATFLAIQDFLGNMPDATSVRDVGDIRAALTSSDSWHVVRSSNCHRRGTIPLSDILKGGAQTNGGPFSSEQPWEQV
jgi:hypothetical protein